MDSRTEPPITSLASLRHGDRALVVGIGDGDPKLGAKLAARGLVPGVEIGVLRGGDPILLCVDEARWALTRNDADLVLVDVIKRAHKSLLRRLLYR
jgi:Fe2+ transport system protein FeoA